MIKNHKVKADHLIVVPEQQQMSRPETDLRKESNTNADSVI